MLVVRLVFNTHEMQLDHYPDIAPIGITILIAPFWQNILMAPFWQNILIAPFDI